VKAYSVSPIYIVGYIQYNIMCIHMNVPDELKEPEMDRAHIY
jgi:hypothetical protein